MRMCFVVVVMCLDFFCGAGLEVAASIKISIPAYVDIPAYEFDVARGFCLGVAAYG